MELNKIKTQLNKIKNENIREAKKTINSADRFEKRNGWTFCRTGCGELGGRYIFAQLTPTQEKKADTLAKYKKMLIEAITKEEEKKNKKAIKRIEEAEKVEGFPNALKIVINWTQSRTWGANPRAEMWGGYFGGYHEGSSVTGCGYDKRSTAAAEVLQSCEALQALALFMLEKQKAETIKKALKGEDVRGIFGYGLRFPAGSVYFGSGCGMSAICEELEKLGYKRIFEHESRTGADVYAWELDKKSSAAKYNKQKASEAGRC